MTNEGRIMGMAIALVDCRSALTDAMSHLAKYMDLLDKDVPVEAFMLGRMLGNYDLLQRMYDELDNVTKEGGQ